MTLITFKSYTKGHFGVNFFQIRPQKGWKIGLPQFFGNFSRFYHWFSELLSIRGYSWINSWPISDQFLSFIYFWRIFIHFCITLVFPHSSLEFISVSISDVYVCFVKSISAHFWPWVDLDLIISMLDQIKM